MAAEAFGHASPLPSSVDRTQCLIYPLTHAVSTGTNSPVNYISDCILIILISAFQLSVIEPVKKEVNQATGAFQRGDYYAAIEFLGRAIEVCINLLVHISECT